MAQLDHLVDAVADLEVGRRWFAERLGVEPAFGGAHPGRGTHNALASLGSSYVELIAPDPGQPPPSGGRPFGLDDVSGPGLVAFAVRPDQGGSIDDLVAAARAAGHDPGDPVAMSRRRPDGSELHWRLTLPTPGDVLPFFIDWGSAEMPSATAPGGLALEGLEVVGPDPGALRSLLAALDLLGDDVVVGAAGEPGLRATIAGPAGSVTMEPAPRRGRR